MEDENTSLNEASPPVPRSMRSGGLGVYVSSSDRADVYRAISCLCALGISPYTAAADLEVASKSEAIAQRRDSRAGEARLAFIKLLKDILGGPANAIFSETIAASKSALLERSEFLGGYASVEAVNNARDPASFFNYLAVAASSTR